MNLTDIILIASTIVLPILSGIGSYIASTSKANKELDKLREQNKLEIEKLMNQHKMDLEALERKHQMEVEKMDLEHKHKVELMQKEAESKVGSDMMGLFGTSLINEVMKSPEIQAEIRKSMAQSFSKKKR